MITDPERRFTADDVRAIRETNEIAFRHFFDRVDGPARQLEFVTRVHDLNHSQVHAARNDKLNTRLSDARIAERLHLITDDIVTIGQLWEFYDLPLDELEEE